MELAAEWVTLLPETSKLVKFLKAFRPPPIVVQVEADTDGMESESRRAGRRAGSSIDREVDRETKGTGRKVGHNINDGMQDKRINETAQAIGRSIRYNVEKETRKINVGNLLGGLFSGAKGAAAGTMQVVRNIGSIALVARVAAKAAKGLSLSLLASGTALKVISAAGVARLGVALGFASHQANKLATQVTRVTSAILVAMTAFRALQIMTTVAKWMSLLTIGTSVLIGVVSAAASVLGTALVNALVSVGAAAGVTAGAMAGLLGPAIVIGKLVAGVMGDAAKDFNKQFKDADEAFAHLIGQRMGPLLTAFRDLKMEVTDTFTKAFQPAFGWLGDAIKNLTPAMGGLATTLGNVGGEIAGSLASPQTQAAFKQMIGASDRFFQNFLGESGLAGLTQGLVQFAATAADTFAGSGARINELLLKAGEFLRNVTGTQMKLVFATLKQQIDNVWAVLKPLLTGIRDIGKISAPALAPGFKALGGALKEALPGLLQMTKILMPALSAVMERLAPIIPDLVRAFTPWAGVLAKVAPPLATIIADLAPLAPLLLVTVGAVKAITIAMALYNTAMLLYSNAGRIATAVQWAWNAAMAANPVGLIVIAIAAAAAAIWAFFTKTETGRQLWAKIWPAIVNAAKVAWEWIKNAFTTLWPYIKTALEGIVTGAKAAWEGIKVGAKALWDFMSAAWNNVGKPTLDIIAQTITWLWQNIWSPAWTGISAVLGVAWEVIKVIWAAFQAQMRIVGGVINWLWNNVAVPAFEGIKQAVQVFWTYAKPIWDLWKAAFDKLIDGASSFKDAFVKGFNTIKDTFKTVWEWIEPKLNSFKEALSKTGSFLNSINPFGNADGGVVPGFAGGTGSAGITPRGKLWGPGNGTSDSIYGVNGSGVPVVRVSAGEGIVRESAMSRGGGAVVAALNAGWVPSPDYLRGMLGDLPGFAEGLNPGADYLRSMVMKLWPSITSIGGRRSEDGYGEHSSGNAIDIMIPNWNTPEGLALGNTIAGFVAKNGSQLGLDGMIWQQKSYGYGGSFFQGKGMSDRGSPTQNHMDHIHVMLGKGRGAGAAAVGLPSGGISLPSGATAAMSSGGAGIAAAGGYGGGSSDGSGGHFEVNPKAVREAEDRVTDLQNSLDNATTRLGELDAKKAKGDKVNESTYNAASDSVTKFTRELAQSKEDLEAARQGKFVKSKASPGSSKSGDGQAGGGDQQWGDVGKMIFSGFLESFGLDGSVFTNLFETPNFKSAMAGVNFLGGLLGSKQKQQAEENGFVVSGQDGSDPGMAMPLPGGVGGSAGMDFLGGLLPGVGDILPQQVAPGQADMAMAGSAGGPTFDLRGSQLGVSPNDFQDKMGEMTASSKRYPSLGPVGR